MKFIGQHIFDLVASFRQDILLPDSKKLILGTGKDAEIYVTSDDLVIVNTANDKDIIFQSDDGTGGTKEYFRLDGSAATSTGITTTLFPDNSKLKLGTGGDFVLFHDGNDSTITNNTGDVIIQNAADDKDIVLKSDNGSGSTTAYITLDGSETTVEIAKNTNFASNITVAGTTAGIVPKIYGNVIKLIPSDFMDNGDGGNTKFGVAYTDVAGTGYGMRPPNNATELYAFVSIPEGMKATHVDIFDKNNLAIEVFEVNINATTMTSKGTGNCNTTLDITDVNSTATNFLAIEVTTTSVNDRVYGGQVTIAAITG
jgi:hypothetical protein